MYNFNSNNYKPLPYFLTLKESKIDGLGLFTLSTIDKFTDIGITHIHDSRFIHNYIRTPLGGFYNHSKSPNVIIESRELFQNKEIKCRVMKTNRRIEKGEELVAFYRLYAIGS